MVSRIKTKFLMLRGYYIECKIIPCSNYSVALLTKNIKNHQKTKILDIGDL